MNDINNTEEDKLLWKAFLSGNNNSLETLYRSYFDQLYDYGNKWLKNSSLVEDSIQDLFIKLIRNRSSLAKEISVKHYLFKAFRSVIFDKLRLKKNIQSIDEIANQDFRLTISPDMKFMQDEENFQIKIRIEDALAKLTARQREAIFLRYSQDISYKKIAEIMDVSTKAAYKLMARAIEALKQTFN